MNLQFLSCSSQRGPSLAAAPREGNAGSSGKPDGNRIKIEGINFGSSTDTTTVAMSVAAAQGEAARACASRGIM